MNLGRLLPITLCFLVATCSVVAVVSTFGEQSSQFAAHEFAVLRSEYTSLRDQNFAHRVELFRGLQSSLESNEITPGMAGSLAEFCEEVLVSGEEEPAVKFEAKLALEALERHRGPGSFDRIPAGVASAKD